MTFKVYDNFSVNEIQRKNICFKIPELPCTTSNIISKNLQVTSYKLPVLISDISVETS